MPQNTQTPLAIFEGQRNQVRLISRTHGVIRPNLVQGFNFTPKFSNKEVAEFDNKVNALTYTTFDGGTGKLEYIDSNQGQISAALMDLDPTVAVQMLNPAELQPFDIFMNLMGQDGLVKGCALLYACSPTSNPFEQTVKDAAKRSIDFTCLNGIWFPGLAMQYTRMRTAGTIQAAPATPTLATADTGGFLAGGKTYYVQLTAVTPYGETEVGNEGSIAVPSGTDTNKITVTTPALSGSITSFNAYISDKSNGERFSANMAGGGDTDILSLPSTTAAQPPLFNTSGAFAATGDKVFATSPAYSVTLDNAAYKLAQTGLQYALVKKNGAIIGTVDNPATAGNFLINTGGTTFTAQDNPATASDVWELLSMYQP